MSHIRVCIVGGGVIGLACAVDLASAQCDVVLIEKDQLAGGSSSLSVGVYTRQYLEPLEIQLRMYCYERLCALERDYDLHLRRIGYLRLARDSATLRQFERGVQLQRSLGLKDAELLDDAGVARLIPAMRTDDLAGGLFGRTDGYLDGHELCMTYAAIAARLGVDIRVRTKLLAAEYVEGAGRLLHTDNGLIKADVVVNAAGAWAHQVGELLGAPLAVFPQRHQALVVSTGRALEYTIPEVMDYVPGSGEEGLYFRHERADALIAGLHTNDLTAGDIDDPDDPHHAVDPDHVEAVARKLVDRLPGLELSFTGGWSGLYPMSADGQVVVGPFTHDSSVIAAACMGGLGVHLSPAVGRLVTDYVTLGTVTLCEGTERLRPGRFNAGASSSGA